MKSIQEKAPAGVAGLDELLRGGFPRSRVILLLGEPGSGKTIFATQFLVNGGRKYNERGIFVTLDEARFHLYREMALFGWNLEQLEKEGKLAFVDATPLRLLPEKVKVGEIALDRKDFSMASLIRAIENEVERVKPQRIAVDSITSLIIQYHDPVEKRRAILDLIGALVATGCTCVVTSELKYLGAKRPLEVEEFLCHGVIILQSLRVGASFTRMLQVEKMRETACDTQPRPYRITEGGIEVYPGETVFK